ncbi:MAG: hypothetical protein LAN63_12835 [Acidobacteriia bacterium]|nr:hypothetical protein [Terriglobia bacterium]
MTTRSLAIILGCIFLQAVLWAECAPDHRSEKNSGLYVADFVVNGTTSIGSTELATIRGKLIGACVDEESDNLEQLVRALFADRGYFTAKINSLDIKTIDPLAVPRHVMLEADITEGAIYKLAEIKFVGNHAFTASTLRGAFTLKPGEVFKRDTIASGLGGVRELYLARGFRDLIFIPETQNLSNATVILTLNVMEGPQYRMGKLRISAKPEIADRLQGAWELPEGAVFDFSYPTKYINANRSLLPTEFIQDDLRLVRDCPNASIEVRLILDQTDPTFQSQPTDVECKGDHSTVK